MNKNLNFYKKLRSFFYNNKNITPSILSYNNTFLDAHITPEIKDGKNQFYINHRCNQWLCDLAEHTKSNPPRLLIEDLQVAYELSGISLDALLIGNDYWQKNLNYVNDEFIDLIRELKDDVLQNNSMKQLFFPVKYNPATATVLACIILQDVKKASASNQLDAKNDSNRDTYLSAHFIVYSLHDIVDYVKTKKQNTCVADSFTQALSFSGANAKFTSVCNNEKAPKNEKTLSNVISRLFIILNNALCSKKLDTTIDILKKQRLFSSYYPNLLSHLKTSSPKKKSLLNEQINIAHSP